MLLNFLITRSLTHDSRCAAASILLNTKKVPLIVFRLPDLIPSQIHDLEGLRCAEFWIGIHTLLSRPVKSKMRPPREGAPYY
jgi:hypothetical protein